MDAESLKAKAIAEYSSLMAQMAPGVAAMTAEEMRATFELLVNRRIREAVAAVDAKLDNPSFIASMEAAADQVEADVSASERKILTQRAWLERAGAVLMSLLIAGLVA